jgi:hypothetical protein
MTKPPPKPEPLVHRPDWPWWTAYGVLLVLVAAGMISLRMWLLSTYGGERAAGEWQHWKEDAAEMEKDPRLVKRRAPKSAEPPGLLLARDYFVPCFAGGMTLSAVLLGAVLLMLRGALASGPLKIHED